MLLDTYEKYDKGPCVVVLGKFDGVHIGHKKLFETARMRFNDTQIVAFTFAAQKESLTSSDEKIELLYDAGADIIIRQRTDNGFFDLSREEFLENVIYGKLQAVAIVCGEDFYFGKNRTGDVGFLRENADKYGYELIVLSDIKYNELTVKSTLIRSELIKGHISEVNSMLGYPYSFSGEVASGNKIGRKYGFPTANIIPPKNKLMPTNGVYATKTLIDGKIYCSMTNIGFRPSVNGRELNIETHIFDFDDDIYGKCISVFLLKYIRPEKTFASLEDLFSQIENDKTKIKEYFKIQVSHRETCAPD